MEEETIDDSSTDETEDETDVGIDDYWAGYSHSDKEGW